MFLPSRSISRRSFAAGIAAAAIIRPRRSLAWSHGRANTFPGQSNNPVGFAAALGYPGSLTVWPGGSLTSGTPGSPTIYSFYDFVGGLAISSSFHDITFVGCRFQSNSVANNNTQPQGARIIFLYCSLTPLVSIVTAPPNAAWPSAGAGAQTVTQDSTYMIGGNNGYQYAFHHPDGPLTADHCDIWGFANAVDFASGTSAQLIFRDCWFHDCAQDQPQGYHQDGPGYLDGGAPQQNILIDHCTVASIGNTNGIAFQAAASPYSNITVQNSFLSGFGYLFDPFHNTSGSTNLSVLGNTFGTDLPWVFGPLYTSVPTLFTQASNPTNLWRGNKLRVLPGTAPIGGSQFSWNAGDNGKYLWPDVTLNSTDWPN